MFSRDRKKASEWTNLAKVLDFGLPEGVYRYVEWLSLFIAKSINFKDFLEKSLLSFCILRFAFTGGHGGPPLQSVWSFLTSLIILNIQSVKLLPKEYLK